MSIDDFTCSKTGLALIAAANQITFRLAKPSYGPLNPQRRGISTAEERAAWNRFDLPGEQTVYAATSPEGAYGELLGQLKKAAPIPASTFLDDAGGVALEDLIRDDWAAMGKPLPNTVDLNWLYEFRLYTVGLPRVGWFVEIEHSRSLVYLDRNIPLTLWERNIRGVTVAELRGSDRDVTTYLAELVSKTSLHDGTVPLGVRYGSKHGSEWDCWAMWLGGVDEAAVAVDDGTAVLAPQFNPALTKILEIYNLTA